MNRLPLLVVRLDMSGRFAKALQRPFGRRIPTSAGGGTYCTILGHAKPADGDLDRVARERSPLRQLGVVTASTEKDALRKAELKFKVPIGER